MTSDCEEEVPGSCIVVPEESDTCKEDGPSAEDEKSEEAESQDGASGITDMNGVPLSKNQLKKLKAKERWLEHRKQKRVEEKERRKNKRKALKESGQGAQLKRFKGRTMAESTCKTRVAVDMSFDSLMTEKDCRRTVQQLSWCYSANRRMEQPLQYHVVAFDGTSKQIYDSVESNKNQDVFIHTEPLDEVFDPSEIVYLTADSDNVLSTLDDSKVYVIGGLVDHNSQKGLCYELAQKKGYGHARLPIDEFVNMKTRKVLTINHVFEILANFSDCGDWEKAFFAVMPKRKGMEKKDDDETKEEGAEEDNGVEDNTEDGSEVKEGEENK